MRAGYLVHPLAPTGSAPDRPEPGRTRDRWPGQAGFHHSDRGSQYASHAYQAALKKAQLRCAMTDGSDCYRNALAERVNGILKDEFLFLLPDDLAQAYLFVDQTVHFNNEERPHLALNHLTPNQFHQ